MTNHHPSSELNIRPASFEDIPFIRDIAAKTWPVAYGSILSKDQLAYMLEMMYSQQALEQQMKDRHYFFLALLNYEAVGFCAFSKIEGSIFKLHKLYVLPGNQKMGLGESLLKVAETTSESMGGTHLQLNVNRNNKAQHFYRKNGFEIIREEDIDIGNGYFMNDFIMEKEF